MKMFSRIGMSFMFCFGMSYQYVASSIENPLPTTIGRKVKITAKHFPDLQQKFPDVEIDPELKILCTVASPNAPYAMKVTNIDSTGCRRSPDIWVTINGPAEFVAQKKRVHFAKGLEDNTGKSHLGISRRPVIMRDVFGDDQEVGDLSRNQVVTSMERNALQDFRFDSPEGALEHNKAVIGRPLVDALHSLSDDQLRALICNSVVFPEPSDIDFATLQRVESCDPTTATIFQNTIKLVNTVSSQIIDRFMDVTCDTPGTLIQYQAWLKTKLIVQVQEILRAQQNKVVARFENAKNNELQHFTENIQGIKRAAQVTDQPHQATLMGYGAGVVVSAGVPVMLKPIVGKYLSTGEKKIFYGLFGAMTVWSLYNTLHTMVQRNRDRAINENAIQEQEEELQHVAARIADGSHSAIAAFDENLARFVREGQEKIIKFAGIEAQRLTRDLEQRRAQYAQQPLLTFRATSSQRLPQRGLVITPEAPMQAESLIAWFGDRLVQGAQAVVRSAHASTHANFSVAMLSDLDEDSR